MTIRPGIAPLIAPAIGMACVSVLSNIGVRHPIGQFLTWGAFTYPASFLINEVTNRLQGVRAARRAALAGMLVGLVASAGLSSVRIALASACAYLCGQFTDASVFDRLRRSLLPRRPSWWLPPAMAALAGSLVDTCLFFSLAFLRVLPAHVWIALALGDFCVKIGFAALSLMPYRVLTIRAE